MRQYLQSFITFLIVLSHSSLTSPLYVATSSSLPFALSPSNTVLISCSILGSFYIIKPGFLAVFVEIGLTDSDCRNLSVTLRYLSALSLCISLSMFILLHIYNHNVQLDSRRKSWLVVESRHQVKQQQRKQYPLSPKVDMCWDSSCYSLSSQ